MGQLPCLALPPTLELTALSGTPQVEPSLAKHSHCMDVNAEAKAPQSAIFKLRCCVTRTSPASHECLLSLKFEAAGWRRRGVVCRVCS